MQKNVSRTNRDERCLTGQHPRTEGGRPNKAFRILGAETWTEIEVDKTIIT